MPQGAIAYGGKLVASAVGYVVGGLGASAGAVSLAYQAAYYAAVAVIQAGLVYGINALTRPRVSRQLGTEIDLQIDPAYPRQMMVGRRAIAGSLGPKYSYGPSNWGASIVYVIADHPMTSLQRVYADGRVIHDTPLVHGVRTEITVFNDGEAHMFMTWHDGRPGQTADAQLISNSAEDPDVIAGKIGGWSSNHKGAGVAYVHVELIFHPDYLVTPPRFLFECEGAPLYDRRLDTTAGGSGSHRLDDPTTWEYTDNAAVALDHYLLGYKVENDDKAFGRGLRPDEVPYETFAALADLCDEDVTTGESPFEEVIKRYRANGMIGAERYFEEIIEELQVQMAARVVDLGGTVGILGAEAKTPVVALTDQDLVEDETIEFADKLSYADLIGAVEGQFSDPGQLWEPTDYERQVSADFTLPDGGELGVLSLPLPFETHPRRAARIARAVLNREMLQPRLVASFMPVAYELEVGDWFSYTDDYLQISDQDFEVIDIIKHPDFTVTLTARAVDPDFVAFPVDEDVDLSVPPDFAPVSLLLSAPVFSAAAVALSGSGTVRPTLRVTITDLDVLAKNVSIEYRDWVGPGAEDFGSFVGTDSHHKDQLVTYLQKGILPGAKYKVRLKARAGIKESPWSDWSSEITATSTESVGSADSVPWGGVTDDGGRPDDNADVTIDNTAGGIVDQGLMATLDALTEAIANASNLLRRASGGLFTGELNADYTLDHTAAGITGQTDWATFGYLTTYLTSPAANMMPYPSGQGSGAAASLGWTAGGGDAGGSGLYQTHYAGFSGNTYQEDFASGYSAGDNRYYVFEVPNSNVEGDYTLSLVGQPYALTGCYAYLDALDSGDVFLTAGEGFTITGSRDEGTITAPSGTAKLRIIIVIPPQTVGGYCNLNFRDIKVERGSAATAYGNERIDAEYGANVTETRVAAGFASQAALATLNFVQLGSNVRLADGTTVATDAILVTASGTASGISGQGGLATQNFVLFSSTVRLADGTTVVTDVMVVTADGTAAGISGQGPWATYAAAIDTLTQPGANLIYNSTGLDGLNKFINVANWYVLDGVDVGRCVVTNTVGAQYLQFPPCPVIAGYPHAFAINAGGGDFTGGYVVMAYYDAGDAFIDYGVGQAVAAGAGYTRIEWNETPPTGATRARMQVGATMVSGSPFLIAYKAKAEWGSAHTPWSDDLTLNKFEAIEDGADVTGNNTASGVSGQGSGATTNFYVQGTDPGGANGSWWADTTANKLKVKISGVWEEVSDLTGGAAAWGASCTNQNQFWNPGGASGSSPNTSVVTVTGATGSATVVWEKISGHSQMGFSTTGTGNKDLIPSVTGASFGVQYDAVYRATITDTAGRVTFVQVAASAIWS